MSAVDEVAGAIVAMESRPYREVKKGYTFFVENDVLFAKITPCMQNGKHAITRNLIDGIGFGSTEFHVLHALEVVYPEWIHSFVRQPRILEAAKAHFSGAVGQQRVPESFLHSLDFPLPPLPEQRRIAGILKEQMAAVEKARAAAEAQLQAARALPAAYLREAFPSPGSPLPAGWRLVRLGEVSEIVGGIQKSPDREPLKHHKPYLTVRNVQQGYLDLTEVERFEISEAELERLQLVKGDLLIVEGNGSLAHIGRNALFNCDGDDWIHQNHIIRVRLSEEQARPEFVSKFLNSPQGRLQMVEKAKTTSGLYTLSTGKVATLEVPLPTLETQEAIMSKLGERLKDAQCLVASSLDELAGINALPAALLRKAFSGGL